MCDRIGSLGYHEGQVQMTGVPLKVYAFDFFLTQKILWQQLKSFFKNVYGRRHDLVDLYNIKCHP